MARRPTPRTLIAVHNMSPEGKRVQAIDAPRAFHTDPSDALQDALRTLDDFWSHVPEELDGRVPTEPLKAAAALVRSALELLGTRPIETYYL